VRGPLVGDHLTDLVRQRQREADLPDPWILHPIPVAFEGHEGLAGTRKFLAIGMQLYADSIMVQIHAPLTVSESGTLLRDPNTKVSLEVKLIHPIFVGALAVGEYNACKVTMPGNDLEPRLLDVRGGGNVIDPLKPLLCRVRMIWAFPAVTGIPADVSVRVTPLFAIKGIENG
jgi:hypothetical protein